MLAEPVTAPGGTVGTLYGVLLPGTGAGVVRGHWGTRQQESRGSVTMVHSDGTES